MPVPQVVALLLLFLWLATLGCGVHPGAEGRQLNASNGETNMLRNRKGFTLIELLIVVVIIGILAAIAIPKFAATKDKAKLASVKTDVRNAETAEEAYFSDYATYGSFSQVSANMQLSSGNTMSISGGASGYTVTATNNTIASGISSCTVAVAGGVASTVDSKITCP
jgi:type IV pilus assembly protein PilA